jgi:hypothetical protein
MERQTPAVYGHSHDHRTAVLSATGDRDDTSARQRNVRRGQLNTIRSHVPPTHGSTRLSLSLFLSVREDQRSRADSGVSPMSNELP